MLRIVRCNDPFFSVRNEKHRVEWKSQDIEENFENLIKHISENKKTAFPYAEHIFKDNVYALKFLEVIKASGNEATLYCRHLTIPAILLQYAIIDEEIPSYDEFYRVVDKTSFSPETKVTIKENLRGLPFSKIEEMVKNMDGLEDAAAAEYIIGNKRNILRQNDCLEVMNVDGNIGDIGGLNELKQWIVFRKDNFSPEARTFGIPMPKGMLMLGVQGCGKSLTSKIIANIWQFPLVRLDFVNLFRQGKSIEELLKEAITLIEGFAPVVLWIDEMEKALSQENQSTEIRRVLGWLMTWMQEKKEPVFLVATANNVEILPPELLRKGRFDEIFFVDLPAHEEREEIFRIHIEKRKRDSANYDLKKLAAATENFSGAEIEQIVVDALIMDYGKNRELSQKSLEEALRRTVPLSVTYDENIKKLRIWSRSRARNASGNPKIEAYFQGND